MFSTAKDLHTFVEVNEVLSKFKHPPYPRYFEFMENKINIAIIMLLTGLLEQINGLNIKIIISKKRNSLLNHSKEQGSLSIRIFFMTWSVNCFTFQM